jgi:hypothetical protein
MFLLITLKNYIPIKLWMSGGRRQTLFIKYDTRPILKNQVIFAISQGFFGPYVSGISRKLLFGNRLREVIKWVLPVKCESKCRKPLSLRKIWHKHTK